MEMADILSAFSAEIYDGGRRCCCHICHQLSLSLGPNPSPPSPLQRSNKRWRETLFLKGSPWDRNSGFQIMVDLVDPEIHQNLKDLAHELQALPSAIEVGRWLSDSGVGSYPAISASPLSLPSAPPWISNLFCPQILTQCYIEEDGFGFQPSDPSWLSVFPLPSDKVFSLNLYFPPHCLPSSQAM